MAAKRKRISLAPSEVRPEEKKKKKLSLEQRLHKALSHPIRVEILDLMNMGEWSPRGLQLELEKGLSFISYHVKVLRDFELIKLTKTEPRRGAVEHYYTALVRPFVPASMSKGMPKSAQKIVGNSVIQRIDEDVAASLSSGRFYERDDWHASWTPAEFDGEACEAAEKLADKFVRDFLSLGAEAFNRRAAGEGDGACIPVAAGLLIFGSSMAENEVTPVKRERKKRGRGV